MRLVLYSDYEATAVVRLCLNATCADKIRWLQLSLANSLSLTKHYVQINTQQHLQAVHIVIYQQRGKQAENGSK